MTPLLAIFIISSFVSIIHEWFSLGGFLLLISMPLILVWYLFFHQPLKQTSPKTILALVLVIFSCLALTLEAEDPNGLLSLSMWLNRLAMTSIPFISLSYLTTNKSRYRYYLLLFLGAIIYFTTLRITQEPNVDIYQILRYGPTRLLQFQNPYLHPINYPFYAYGPTTIYFFLPIDILFNDPRVLLVISVFITSLSIYYLALKSNFSQPISELLSLLFLFYPKHPYLLKFSWTDNFIIALITLSLVAFKKNKPFLTGALISLAVGVKIFYLLPYLFFLKINSFRSRKLYFGFIVTFFLIHAPFLLSWRALYDNLYVKNLDPNLQIYLHRAGTTLATFLDRQFHWYPPNLFFTVTSLITTAFFWLVLPRTSNLSRGLLYISLVFFILLIFSPTGTASYFLSASSFILLSLTTSPHRLNLYKTAPPKESLLP